MPKLSREFNLIKGRFPAPWGVRSAKKWLFHTPSACGGVVDSPDLKVFIEGGEPSVHWTFAEWGDSKHINRGRFEFEPTLDNFLAAAVEEAQSEWDLNWD